MLISGVRFVLEKLAAVVDQELNDDTVLHERLLEAQMRYESGELSDQEFADVERDVLARLRTIREQREAHDPSAGESGAIGKEGEYRITGVEASFDADDVHQPLEHARPADLEPEPEPAPARRATARKRARARAAGQKPTPGPATGKKKPRPRRATTRKAATTTTASKARSKRAPRRSRGG